MDHGGLRLGVHAGACVIPEIQVGLTGLWVMAASGGLVSLHVPGSPQPLLPKGEPPLWRLPTGVFLDL